METNQCFIFISYKSENSNFTRTLFEAFRSLGCEAWFAEYEVIIFDREKFKSKIEEGIKLADRAVLVTDQSYWTSEACIYEAYLLLRKLESLDRIINLKLKNWDIPQKINIKASNLTKDYPQLLSIESIHDLIICLQRAHNLAWDGSMLSFFEQLKTLEFIPQSCDLNKIKYYG